jgi:hypothetical protein
MYLFDDLVDLFAKMAKTGKPHSDTAYKCSQKGKEKKKET